MTPSRLFILAFFLLATNLACKKTLSSRSAQQSRSSNPTTSSPQTLCLTEADTKPELIPPQTLSPPLIEAENVELKRGGNRIANLRFSLAPEQSCPVIRYQAFCAGRLCSEGFTAKMSISLTGFPREAPLAFDGACCVEADRALRDDQTKPTARIEGIELYCGKTISEQTAAKVDLKPILGELNSNITHLDHAACELGLRRHRKNHENMLSLGFRICQNLRKKNARFHQASVLNGLPRGISCVQQAEALYDEFNPHEILRASSKETTTLNLAEAATTQNGEVCLDLAAMEERARLGMGSLALTESSRSYQAPPRPDDGLANPAITCESGFDLLADAAWGDDTLETMAAGVSLIVVGAAIAVVAPIVKAAGWLGRSSLAVGKQIKNMISRPAPSPGIIVNEWDSRLQIERGGVSRTGKAMFAGIALAFIGATVFYTAGQYGLTGSKPDARPGSDSKIESTLRGYQGDLMRLIAEKREIEESIHQLCE